MTHNVFEVSSEGMWEIFDADTVEGMDQFAKVMYKTECKEVYKDSVIYFSRDDTKAQNELFCNIGAYGTVVICAEYGSDTSNMIREHLTRLAHDEYYRKQYDSLRGTLSSWGSVYEFMTVECLGDLRDIKEYYYRPADKRVDGRQIKDSGKVFQDIALVIRGSLIRHNKVDGTAFVFNSEGYIKHKFSCKEYGYSYYETPEGETEPRKFDLLVSLPLEVAKDIDDLSTFAGLGLRLANELIACERLNETTWVFYRVDHDEWVSASEADSVKTSGGIYQEIAFRIRSWLKQRGMLEGSALVFNGKGYIKHVKRDGFRAMYYEAGVDDDKPREFDLLVSLPIEATEGIGSLSFAAGTNELEDREQIDCLRLNETTWCYFSWYTAEQRRYGDIDMVAFDPKLTDDK